MQPAWKPAYLIHGDDHGRLAERRAKLRALAELESGANGVELLEGDEPTPDQAANALSAMTFAIGRRLRDRRRRRALEGRRGQGSPAPRCSRTCRPTRPSRSSRARTQGQGAEGAARRGQGGRGRLSAEQVKKARELPRWVVAEARKLQIELDHEAATALVAATGERQQRLLRELEKLALEHGPGRA
jgi:DNA polymerase-3 subunit delta